MMKCPECGKEMLRGTVISSGSMPFSTKVIFKPERNDVCPNTILEKDADAYICMDCGQVFAIYKVK